MESIGAFPDSDVVSDIDDYYGGSIKSNHSTEFFVGIDFLRTIRFLLGHLSIGVVWSLPRNIPYWKNFFSEIDVLGFYCKVFSFAYSAIGHKAVVVVVDLQLLHLFN